MSGTLSEMTVQASYSNIHQEIDYKWHQHQVRVEFSSSSLNLWPRQLSSMSFWVMTSALALSLTCFRPCVVHHSFLRKFTSSLSLLSAYLHLMFPTSPQTFLQKPIIWGHLHSPSWDPLPLSCSVSHSPRGFAWNPLTSLFLRLSVPEIESNFLTTTVYYLVLTTVIDFKGSYQHPKFLSNFYPFIFIALKSMFLPFLSQSCALFSF